MTRTAAVVAFFILCLSKSGIGQIAGGKSAAMGGAAVAIQDHWSTFNNVAGLAGVKHFSAGIYATRPFNIEGLEAGALALALPIKDLATVGLDVDHSGLENLYTRQSAGVSLARSFGDQFHAGLKLRYLRLFATEYGSDAYFFLQAGVQYQFSDELRIGADIVNPTGVEVESSINEQLPMRVRVGGLYEFSKALTLSLQAEKEDQRDLALAAGLSYKASERLSVMLGGRLPSTQLLFGLGLHFKDISFYISMAYHNSLGLSPHTSFDYEPVAR